MFDIEDGVPIPPRPRGTRLRYPWRDMAIGQSIVGPKSARSAAHQYAANHPDFRFAARRLPDGNYRIWRVEP